jgi:hypothetical protein
MSTRQNLPHESSLENAWKPEPSRNDAVRRPEIAGTPDCAPVQTLYTVMAKASGVFAMLF